MDKITTLCADLRETIHATLQYQPEDTPTAELMGKAVVALEQLTTDLDTVVRALELVREKASGAGYDPTQAVSEIDDIVREALSNINREGVA